MDATAVRDWQVLFESLGVRISGCFGRRDLCRRATAYLRGLLGSVQRKNSWQLAELAGDATPHGFQRLLGRASWDANRLRDEVGRYVIDHLLVEGDDGVLIVDETGKILVWAQGNNATLWDPGDGSLPLSGTSFNHTYLNDGQYTLTPTQSPAPPTTRHRDYRLVASGGGDEVLLLDQLGPESGGARLGVDDSETAERQQGAGGKGAG